jgi:hypothetical protein
MRGFEPGVSERNSKALLPLAYTHPQWQLRVNLDCTPDVRQGN